VFFVKTVEFNEPKIWVRFKTMSLGDYYYLEIGHWDAICFKPLKDVFFFGFGVLGSYN
jgi:hypothetical protein